MPTLAERFIESILKTPAGKKFKSALAASPITDHNFFPQGLTSSYIDRTRYDRDKILAENLRAWRVNPLARRIVKLYTEFVVGEGVSVKASHKATQNFVSQWWTNDQNVLDEQIPEWMDELTRSGHLFILFSIDPVSGMSYVRALPSDSIKEIQSAENDIRHELFYITHDLNTPPYPAYDQMNTLGSVSTLQGFGSHSSFVFHYAANRLVGCQFGEADLTPMLSWIGKYSNWLEDRARLNRFRQAFVYVLKGKFASKADQAARSNEINANPPVPGSVLVANENESWEVINPRLASYEAGQDGLSIKKMVALGAGIPIHYLAEPESSTTTTAEAAGTPTFRGLEQTQTSFVRMLTRVVKIAVRIRQSVNSQGHLNPDSVEVVAPDITERDNAILSLAVQRIYPVLAELFDRDGIDEAELLRLVYRMAGEAYDEAAQVPKMKKKPLIVAARSSAPIAPASPSTPSGSNPSSPESNNPDEKGIQE